MRSTHLLGCALLAALVSANVASALVPEKDGNYILPEESGKVPYKKTPIPKKCGIAIIGGGAGGVYAAYRLLSGVTPKPDVCIFEANDRLGGRIHTLRGLGEYGDLAVDTGAYRYVDGRHTLVQGVVENLLELDYALYDPASTTFRKIVDEEGSGLGFVTFVEGLAEMALDMGLRLWFKTPVAKVDRAPGNKKQYILTLGTEGKKQIIADKVIFNVPARPLYKILQASNIVRITEWNEALSTPFPQMAAKMYMYYEDAWWIYMNRTTGSFNDPNLGNATYNDTSLFTTPPMRARYHDGEYKCNADKTKCYGFLLYTYAGDNGGTWSRGNQGLDINPYSGVVPRYYWNYAVNPTEDKEYVVLDTTSHTGKNMIMDAHAKLVAYHESIGAPIPEPYAGTLPTMAVVAVWDASISFSGGAWHSYKNGAAGAVFGPNSTAAPSATLKPFAGEDLYVANEAFSSETGWAEGSLIMAENIVYTMMGASRPTFIDAERHDCVLQDTYRYNATLCSASLNPIQGVQRRRSALATKVLESVKFKARRAAMM